MIEIYSNRLLRLLTFGQSFRAFTLGIFIIYRDKSCADPRTQNHERIHVAQQVEMLFVGMWLVYGLSYLINRVKLWRGQELPDHKVKYKTNHMKAYYNIVFEREAYARENDLNHLKNRRLWEWLKYIY